MKGYGFPSSSNNSSGGGGGYKEDTSKCKTQLVETLKKSEGYWNQQGKQQQSIAQLRKAISLLQFIIENETISQVKKSYSDKLEELKGRLKNRVKENEQQKYVASNGGGYKADTSKYKTQLIEALQKSEGYWNQQGKQQQSIIYLRKAISLLQFIIENETINQVKKSYSDKLEELKGRLKNRVKGKEQQN